MAKVTFAECIYKGILDVHCFNSYSFEILLKFDGEGDN